MKYKSITFSFSERNQIDLIADMVRHMNIAAFAGEIENHISLKKELKAIGWGKHNSFLIFFKDNPTFINNIKDYYAIVNLSLEEFMPLFEKYKKLKAFS